MPNPFVRVNTPVQSKTPPARPEPVAPVVEHMRGDNNPYRGIESHGVKANTEPAPTGAWADNHTGFTYVEEPPVQDPIPVEIVNQYGREYRRSRVHRMSVDNTRGLPFVGKNDDRISILIQNRDAANSVYLAFAPIDQGNFTILGFELAKGEELTLTSQGAIYVVGSSAAYVTLQAIETFAVKE